MRAMTIKNMSYPWHIKLHECSSETLKGTSVPMNNYSLTFFTSSVIVFVVPYDDVFKAYMTEEDHTFQLFSGSATSVLNLWNRIKVGPSVRIPYVLSSSLGMWQRCLIIEIGRLGRLILVRIPYYQYLNCYHSLFWFSFIVQIWLCFLFDCCIKYYHQNNARVEGLAKSKHWRCLIY